MTRSTSALLLAVLAVSACHQSRGGRAEAGDLAVTHAVIPEPASRSEASAFFVLENRGAASVAFTGATTPVADSVLLHRLVGGLMQPAMSPEVPAHGSLDFVPGGYHLMLEGLRQPLAIGDTVTLALRFGTGATLTVHVPVLNYTDAVSELPLR